MKRKLAAGIATAAFAVLAMGGTASAGHTHCMDLPSGTTIEVAEGSTSQTSGGAFHQFHHNVHLGATGDPGTPGDDFLGGGHSPVRLYKVGTADC